jgi:hypothetical protein
MASRDAVFKILLGVPGVFTEKMAVSRIAYDLENELKHYDEDFSLKKAEENSWKRRDDVLKHDKLLQGSLLNHVPWRPLKSAGNLSFSGASHLAPGIHEATPSPRHHSTVC